jgi:hypothetical protein
LLDALCSRRSHEIQVKAVRGIASDRLTAAAYAPMAERRDTTLCSGIFEDRETSSLP